MWFPGLGAGVSRVLRLRRSASLHNAASPPLPSAGLETPAATHAAASTASTARARCVRAFVSSLGQLGAHADHQHGSMRGRVHARAARAICDTMTKSSGCVPRPEFHGLHLSTPKALRPAYLALDVCVYNRSTPLRPSAVPSPIPAHHHRHRPPHIHKYSCHTFLAFARASLASCLGFGFGMG
jgi:hypothetical protein